MTLSRFAYVQYDALAAESQNNLRMLCMAAETEISVHTNEQNTPPKLEDFYLYIANTAIEGEYKQAATSAMLACVEALKNDDKLKALHLLEEAYFWAGKFIRLAQISHLPVGAQFA